MPPKPKLASFPTLEAYLEALVDWKIEERAAYDRDWLHIEALVDWKLEERAAYDRDWLQSLGVDLE